MEKINPDNAFFIKLGEAGRWDRECIEVENSVKVGFVEFTHEELLDGDWEKVREYYRQQGVVPSWVTIYTNQLINFYESSKNTLWITFYNQKLWWAFAEEEVYPDQEGNKYRRVIEKWKSTDMKGKELFIENLNGNLTKVQAFRSTICKVFEKDYLIRKINGEESPEIMEVQEDLKKLKLSLGKLISQLRPGDFELLIDLIFRNLGCRRVSTIGRTQKTKDIELEAPVTEERYIVQVKSSSNLREFKEYEAQFKGLTGYNRRYFVVHSPAADLQNYDAPSTENVVLWRMDEVTEFSIHSGLVNWIIHRAS